MAAWMSMIYGNRYPFDDTARARMILPRSLWKAETDALEEIELAEMEQIPDHHHEEE